MKIMPDNRQKTEELEKLEEDIEALEKEIAEDQKKPQEKQEIKFSPNFQFIEIKDEAQRVYIYPDGQQIPVKNVTHLSIKPDGSHRLYSGNDYGSGLSMSAGWRTIIYKATPGKPYNFCE